MSGVAVVTDSTAYLPRGWAADAGIRVVPVQVIIGGQAFDETDDDQAEQVAGALHAWQPVTTSRPSPVRFLDAFRQAQNDGATQIAVVTLSSAMSATHESALLAAKEFALEVEVVDSRTIAMALGFAALTGAACAARGGSLADVVTAMRRRARESSAFFYVDTLEYLRRGGRVGSAKAAVAQALQVKPILHVDEGRVVQLDQVRTSTKALARLEQLALDKAREALSHGTPIDLAVQHLAAPERAADLAARLRAALPDSRVVECAVGGVVGAHVGPGMVAVAVSPIVGDHA